MLIIIRGLPGSGKSTKAKELLVDHSWVHVEADMFYTYDGKYNFEHDLLNDAHDWCLLQVKYYLIRALNVVVSNTFSRNREMDPYMNLALEWGIPFSLIECENDYGSVHNVPAQIIHAMKERWEKIPSYRKMQISTNGKM